MGVVDLTAILSYLRIGLTNPGVVRKRVEPPSEGHNVCNFCNVRKEGFAKHCFDCNVCVRGYDHHCPWIGKCVGEGNVWNFYIFILSVFMSFLVSIIANVNLQGNLQ